MDGTKEKTVYGQSLGAGAAPVAGVKVMFQVSLLNVGENALTVDPDKPVRSVAFAAKECQNPVKCAIGVVVKPSAQGRQFPLNPSSDIPWNKAKLGDFPAISGIVGFLVAGGPLKAPPLPLSMACGYWGESISVLYAWSTLKYRNCGMEDIASKLHTARD